MMSNDMLGDRRKTMEEAFFARENEALRQRVREMNDTRRKKEALSAASGITHDAVLEKLAAQGAGRSLFPCRRAGDGQGRRQP